MGVKSHLLRHVRTDLVAAATVALVGLPQCLAYALMSGLPPAYGLATAAVPGFVAAVVGKSPHIVTGPTNTTGLLILAALGPFLGDNGLLRADGLSALATLSLMAGAIRVLAAYSGGAALVEFIPESVLTGFTAGAGVLIATMQLDEALGLSGVRGGNALAELQQVADRLAVGAITWTALAVTLLTVASILLVNRIWRGFPMALVAVMAATLTAMVAGLDAASGLPVVSDRAAVPAGWPPGALPRLDPELMRDFIGPAAAIALLGTMELAVSARRGRDRPDMRREIVAQGAANLVGAFAGAFPASASLTRSALLQLGGARTRLSAALAALLVVPILLAGDRFVAAMPQASLAGVLWVTALGMIDRPRIRRMWAASRVTRQLLLATFGATLILPLEWAVFSGVGLGIAHHLASGRFPRLQLLSPYGERLVPIEPAMAGKTLVIEVSGDCHFAAAPSLFSRIERTLVPATRTVIVDLSHARALRFSALLALEHLNAMMIDRGGHLYLAGVDPEFCQLLTDTGSKLDAEPYQAEPLASVRAVLARITAHESPRVCRSPQT